MIEVKDGKQAKDDISLRVTALFEVIILTV